MEILLYIYLGIGIFAALFSTVASFSMIGKMSKDSKKYPPIVILISIPITLIIGFLIALLWPIYVFIYLPFHWGRLS